jgi:hypothetical protein
MKRQKANKRGEWTSVIKEAKVLRTVESRDIDLAHFKVILQHLPDDLWKCRSRSWTLQTLHVTINKYIVT